MNNLKEKVIGVSQRMYHEGLVAATSGNISYYDRKNGRIYITPSSIPYDDLTAGNIVTLDLEGNKIEGSNEPSSEWQMHLQIYRNMEEINAIVHTHSVFATSFAVVRQPIDLILIEMDGYLGGAVPLADFAPPGTVELGNTAVQALRKNNTTCLLSNHGALAVGEDLDDAYTKAVYLEDAAKIYYHARNLGNPVLLK